MEAFLYSWKKRILWGARRAEKSTFMNSGVCVSRHVRLGNYPRESKKISHYLEQIYKKYKKINFL